MKTLVFLLSCFALFSCTGNINPSDPNKDKTSNKVKNDLALRGLKGKVRSVVEENYKLIEQSGTIQKKLTDKTISMFNENGNWTTVTFYSEQDLSYTEKYEYNELGQKKQMKKYSIDNALQRKVVYYYNSQGNDTENINYTPTGSFESKGVYKYDNRNNRIEEHYYFPDEKSNNKVINKYDDSNNLIEFISYNADSVVGNHIEIQFENMSDIVGTKFYYSGVLIDEKTKFEKFDKVGNWCEETIFIKGKPERVIERKIEYYR